MEIITNKILTARKTHICCLCGEKINKGEKYHRQVCTDGYIYSTDTHIECRELASKLDMWDDCDDDGLSLDHFEECINEYLQDHHSEEKAIWDMHEQVLDILEELKMEETK